jgi:ankyrin repeat protein
MASKFGHLPVIEFLLDNNADINKQDDELMTPLHLAIRSKRIDACRLILEYERVSSQSIESGITLSRAADVPEIRVLLEKAFKSRRKFILVCLLIEINIL